MGGRRSLFLEVVGAAALVAVLTGSIVGLANLRAGRAVLDGQLRHELRKSSALVRAALSERIASACSLVDATAKDPDLAADDLVAVQQELDRRIEDASLLANLYYYVPDGTLAAVAYHDGRDIERYLGRKLIDPNPEKSKPAVNKAIASAVASGEPAFSKAFVDSERTPMFVYVVPVQRADGQAVLSSGIKGSDPRLGRILEALRPAHGGFVALVDPEFGVVVRAGDPPADLALDELALDKVSSRGRYLVSKETEERTGLAVVIGVPESATLEPLETLSRDVIASTLLAIFVAALLAAAFARRLGQPLQALVEALRAVQRGAYAHRIDAEASGELGEAVEAFNDMAGKLQRSRVIERVWTETWDE